MNRAKSWIIGAGVAGLIVVACFSEHSPAGPDNSALCSSPGGSVVNGSTLVHIRQFSFQTQNVTIQAGTSVTWVNCESPDTPAHTSTSDGGSGPHPCSLPELLSP